METTGRTDTEMALFLDGELISEDDDGGSGDNACITYMVTEGKRYIVRVKAYSRDTGPYGFNVKFNELFDSAMEPNDTRESAYAINPDGEVQAYLAMEDIDWYTVTLPVQGIFGCETLGNVDTLLSLFDAKGRELASDDDSGSRDNAKLSGFLNAGTYFIRVRGYHGETGQYTLKTELRIPPEADQYEPDNARTAAKEIKLNETQKRSFTNKDDVDWAFINIPSAGRYRFRAIGESNRELDTYLGLYKGDTLIGEDDDSGGGYASMLELQLNPGTYHIRVHFLDSNPTDWYLLRAERR